MKLFTLNVVANKRNCRPHDLDQGRRSLHHDDGAPTTAAYLMRGLHELGQRDHLVHPTSNGTLNIACTATRRRVHSEDRGPVHLLDRRRAALILRIAAGLVVRLGSGDTVDCYCRPLGTPRTRTTALGHSTCQLRDREVARVRQPHTEDRCLHHASSSWTSLRSLAVLALFTSCADGPVDLPTRTSCPGETSRSATVSADDMKADGNWGAALTCKELPNLPPLTQPKITLSIDGLTLRLTDAASGYDKVFPVGPGQIRPTDQR